MHFAQLFFKTLRNSYYYCSVLRKFTVRDAIVRTPTTSAPSSTLNEVAEERKCGTHED
jgi:hypothetical protein